jgi:hypothetical protein
MAWWNPWNMRTTGEAMVETFLRCTERGEWQAHGCSRLQRPLHGPASIPGPGDGSNWAGEGEHRARSRPTLTQSGGK